MGLNQAAAAVVDGVRPRVVAVEPVAGLCHDLRQPIAAILMLAGAAAADAGDDAQARKRLQQIVNQASWLSQLVDDVLGSDPARDVLRVINVSEVVAHCVERTAATYTGDVRIAVDDRPCTLARPVALRRAIENVLDNAVRAAGAGGTVEVEVRSRNGTVEVAIGDNGPGFGGSPALTSLGLALSRAFIAACGGGITIGASPADGALVTLSFPELPVAVMRS